MLLHVLFPLPCSTTIFVNLVPFKKTLTARFNFRSGTGYLTVSGYAGDVVFSRGLSVNMLVSPLEVLGKRSEICKFTD